ncbi:hypothetical protein HMPREF1548_06382, partial [Clostridium sp. KLE 1755]
MLKVRDLLFDFAVEAYVASWIEMVQQILVFARIVPSRLMLPRG